MIEATQQAALPPHPLSSPGPSDGHTRIDVHRLTKEYADLTAVDDLTFTVSPGRVTGFLGPNGAGKTTTLRMLLGLVAPTRGTATIGGRLYVDLPEPTQVVGAVLEASSAHRDRTGRNHLRAACIATGLDISRADETLELVGLEAAADRHFKGYSLGMRQRLGIASAMLGDPDVLILDEPANGLDPEGIRWMRTLLQGLAEEGRTVLVSSHLLSEMQALADEVVIVAAGRLVRQGAVREIIAPLSAGCPVQVSTPAPERLKAALESAGAEVRPAQGATLAVIGLDEATIGDTAFAANIPVHRLYTETPDLEDAFLSLTHGEAAIR
jgi:ABC-2 type transport system ATP-binding protein